MQTIKKIGSFIYGIFITSLILIAGLLALSSLDFPNTPKVYTVQSGSMEPTLKVGSLIFSFAQPQYKKGDVITFKSQNDITLKNPKSTTTHRIHDIKTEKGSTVYITKGDANNTSDLEPVIEDQIVGKVSFSLPFLGYPISFARTQNGLIILIIIPTTLIVYSELLNIKKEITSLLQKKNNSVQNKESLK